MKAIIVDDEFMLAEYLRELVRQHCAEITDVAVFTNSVEALKHLNTHSADIVFLDIEMPGLSGLDLVEVLETTNMPAVIFTTAYSQYAVKAFDLAASHYLLKPIDPAKLQEAVARVSTPQEEAPAQSITYPAERLQPGTIGLPDGQDYHIVAIPDIVRVEGSGSYAHFFLNDGRKITVSRRLKSYIQLLLAHGFVHPHISHLVNKAFIRMYSRSSGGFIELKNGDCVPVSASMRAALKEALRL